MKRRYILSWLILSTWGSSLVAQDIPELSEDAIISVLTMGPDKNELYSAFGHNAIRVFDPVLGIDKAYNYGTFNYDDPNFYVNFTKGDLLYFLSVGESGQLLRIYEYFDRWINEQVLDLSLEERQRVFNYLENNALPENANYYYDYFYDNCASRIRDVFAEVFSDSIRFDMEYVPPGMTVRELTDIYLEGKFPWGDLGIDICLGLPMDKRISGYDYMFLPDFIESGFNHTYIKDKTGEERPLVKSTKSIYTSRSAPEATFFSPLFVSISLLVIGLLVTWMQWRVARKGKWFDFTWFFILGLLGLLLTGLWFLTDHKAAAYNFNILWAFPLHAIAAFLLFVNSIKRKRYFNLVGWAMLLLVIFWSFLPQDLHYSLIPIVLLTMVRAFYISHSYAYNHQKI